MCQFGVCYGWEKCYWLCLMLHIPIAVSAIGSLCARIDVWERKMAPFSKKYTLLYSKLYVLGEKNSIHSNILLKRSNSIKLGSWVQLFNFSTFFSWHPDSAVPSLVCFELENSKTWKLQNYGTTELRNYGTTEPQNYGTTELQNYRTTESQNYGTTETAELQNYRTTELRNYGTTELQNYRTTELQNHRTTELQNHRTTELRNLNSSFKFNMYENIVENILIESFSNRKLRSMKDRCKTLNVISN
jgi:hypothetical protein